MYQYRNEAHRYTLHLVNQYCSYVYRRILCLVYQYNTYTRYFSRFAHIAFPHSLEIVFVLFFRRRCIRAQDSGVSRTVAPPALRSRVTDTVAPRLDRGRFGDHRHGTDKRGAYRSRRSTGSFRADELRCVSPVNGRTCFARVTRFAIGTYSPPR